ncbi:hypothetical protein E4T56_gene18979 [Termitomyces sp. T112]|nr:hypothetical protein E4T56_gene18979 [Termitomyces sp. T112]
MEVRLMRYGIRRPIPSSRFLRTRHPSGPTSTRPRQPLLGSQGPYYLLTVPRHVRVSLPYFRRATRTYNSLLLLQGQFGSKPPKVPCVNTGRTLPSSSAAREWKHSTYIKLSEATAVQRWGVWSEREVELHTSKAYDTSSPDTNS